MYLRRVPFSLESSLLLALVLVLVLALVLASLVKTRPKSLIYTPKRDHEHPQPFKKGRLPGRERGDNRDFKQRERGRRRGRRNL